MLDDKIKDIDDDTVEVLEFLKSEIVLNAYTIEETITHLEKLVNTYPTNPEFRNSLAIYYKRQSKCIEAIEQLKIAMNIEPNNETYLNSIFSADCEYIESLISQNEFDKGLARVS